tara:strand:+ start:1655 stop:2152 length:498 start_codon:yes stop_codon:yes gene_type:complete
MEQLNTSMESDNWQSVNTALESLDISRRTLYDYIKKGKLQTKKEGKYRFVWIDDDVSDSIRTSKSAYTETYSSHINGTVSFLEEQVKYLQEQNSKLTSDIKEQNQRHDAIVLSMSETISNQKVELLESRQSSNTRILELEGELKSHKTEMDNLKNRGFWSRLFNR